MRKIKIFSLISIAVIMVFTACQDNGPGTPPPTDPNCNWNLRSIQFSYINLKLSNASTLLHYSNIYGSSIEFLNVIFGSNGMIKGHRLQS